MYTVKPIESNLSVLKVISSHSNKFIILKAENDLHMTSNTGIDFVSIFLISILVFTDFGSC
jgi:hypothetical protein